MTRQKGLYAGTEIDEKWWRRHTKDKLFLRGNGEYWHDERGFYFRRYLTEEPIFIPFEALIAVKTGSWHGGRWAWGMPFLKLVWRKGGERLCSGFLVSKHAEETLRLKETFESFLPRRDAD